MVTDKSETLDCIPAQFGDIDRHWCPYSEPFTGCDSLFSAIWQGWRITGAVFCREKWYSGGRRNFIYHFRLVRGEELCRMAVIQNPTVINFINQEQLHVLMLVSVPNGQPETHSNSSLDAIRDHVPAGGSATRMLSEAVTQTVAQIKVNAG